MPDIKEIEINGDVYDIKDEVARDGLSSIEDGSNTAFLATLLELIYPVGSIYMSTNNVDPSTFIGGRWTRIEDRFLLASGEAFTAGTEDGNATHTHTTGDHVLSVSELPTHKHSVTIINSGNHKHSSLAGGIKYGSNYCAAGSRSGVGANSAATNNISTGEAGTHSHTATIGNTGDNQAHNHGDTGVASNMPPFLAVNVWKRTS